MKSSKKLVRAVYPQAIVIEDTGSDYKSEWAVKSRYSVGFFKIPMDLDPEKVFKTTYYFVTADNKWEFLSGWHVSKAAAWKRAWEAIEREMLQKFQQ